MALPKYYPKANHTAQWKPGLAGGGYFESVEKLLLHTTETQGWPSYPSFAPTLTYNPWTHEWRQHFDLRRSATTLADPSWTAVRENRDHIIQVEIVAYCDRNLSKRYGHSIYDIDDRAKKDLGLFAAWLHEKAGLKLASSVTWKEYPSSYGLNNGVRLSGPKFDAYRGILGHQHASGGDHGDPGKIDIDAILKYAKAAGPKPTPAKDEKPWSGKLWTIKKAEAWDGAKNRRPEHDIPAGKQVEGMIDDDFANDGDYWQTGKAPHRFWYALRNGDWSHDKGGKPIR